jgi:hypothetical protein
MPVYEEHTMSQNWTEKMTTALDATSVRHAVNGEAFDFFPIPIETAFRLRAFIAPLSNMMSTMFEDTSKDATVIQRSLSGSESGEEIISEAISETLASMRADRQTRAINSFVEQVTSDDALRILAEIIMASMRTEFPPTGAHKYPIAEFLAVTPLPMMGGLLHGVWLANKEVFGPLGKMVEAVADLAKDRVKERMGGQPSEIKLSGAPSSPDGH